MKVTEITVTYGGKLNLGDYNSAQITLTASALLDEDEGSERAIAGLFELVKTQVREQAAELFRKRGVKVEEIFAGLPVEAQEQLRQEPYDLAAATNPEWYKE